MFLASHSDEVMPVLEALNDVIRLHDLLVGVVLDVGHVLLRGVVAVLLLGGEALLPRLRRLATDLR